MPIPARRKGESDADYRKRIHDVEVAHGKPDDVAWAIAYDKVPDRKNRRPGRRQKRRLRLRTKVAEAHRRREEAASRR